MHNVSANMHPGDVCVGHFTCEGHHTGEATAEQLCATHSCVSAVSIWIRCG